MYLREMGGVELLSREGEIAIAKRIEAGKDVMINALTQSPLVGKKISDWKEQLESNQLLVRDIIDIDSTYEDFEASENEEETDKSKERKKAKKQDENEKKPEETNSEEEDEFNISLAKMEEEIKPKIISIITTLNKKIMQSSKSIKEKNLVVYWLQKNFLFQKIKILKKFSLY